LNFVIVNRLYKMFYEMQKNRRVRIVTKKYAAIHKIRKYQNSLELYILRNPFDFYTLILYNLI